MLLPREIVLVPKIFSIGSKKASLFFFFYTPVLVASF